MFARQMVVWIVPVSMMLLGIPLIFERVPRNPFYGLRTAFTMSSDEIWYRANKISGVALLLAGIAWLGLGLVLTSVMDDQRSAYRDVALLGAGFLAVGQAVAYWLASRKAR